MYIAENIAIATESPIPLFLQLAFARSNKVIKYLNLAFTLNHSLQISLNEFIVIFFFHIPILNRSKKHQHEKITKQISTMV